MFITLNHTVGFSKRWGGPREIHQNDALFAEISICKTLSQFIELKLNTVPSQKERKHQIMMIVET